jgi:hypothetical protein
VDRIARLGRLGTTGDSVEAATADALRRRIRIAGWVDQRHADFLKVRSEAIRLVKQHSIAPT